MKDHIVEKSIIINAEPGAVWDALTNPEKTKEYFFNCQVISNWKAGSPITFKGRMFLIFKIEMKGEIIKVEPGKLLKYTLKNKGSDSISTVTDKLTYANRKTTVLITDNVGSGDEAASRYKKSVKGWDKILKGLKELVEAGN